MPFAFGTASASTCTFSASACTFSTSATNITTNTGGWLIYNDTATDFITTSVRPNTDPYESFQRDNATATDNHFRLGLGSHQDTLFVSNAWAAITDVNAMAPDDRTAAERKEADRLAMKLLNGHLTYEQRRCLRRHDFFEIESELNNLYKINKKISNNVKLLDKYHKEIKSFCIHPRDVPVGDVMLAQKFYLETMETKFLEIANKNAVESRENRKLKRHNERESQRCGYKKRGIIPPFPDGFGHILHTRLATIDYTAADPHFIELTNQHMFQPTENLYNAYRVTNPNVDVQIVQEASALVAGCTRIDEFADTAIQWRVACTT